MRYLSLLASAFVAIVLMFSIVPHPVYATGWYSASWADRVAVTVQSAQVSGTQTNYPVYVDLSLMPAAFFSNVRSDGGDIRVTQSDGTTEIAREVVSINTGTDIGELFFIAPSISSGGSTTFYIYYGNAAATNYANNATFGAQNVWDTNYVAVYHGGSPSSVSITDSTSLANNGTNSGLTAGTGQLGGAMTGNGSSEDATVANATSLNSMTALSVELWSKITSYSPNTNGVIWVTKNVSNSSATDPYELYSLFDDNTGIVYFRVSDGTVGSYVANTVQTGAAYFPTNTWTSVAGTWNGTTLNIYKNGVAFATPVSSTIAAVGSNTTPLTLGNFGPAGFNYFLNGGLDEVRISKVARAASWITTEYNNESADSSFLSFSSQQTNTGIAFVNSAQAWSSANGTSFASGSFVATTGNTLWMFVDVQNGGLGTLSVTDTAGNTWTQIGSVLHPNPGTGVNYIYQFSTENITGNAADVVTFHDTSVMGTYEAMGVEQFSGFNVASPAVLSSTGTNTTGTALTTGTIANTTSCAYAGGMEGDGQPLTAGSGFTLTSITSGSGYTGFEYNVTASAIAVSASQSLSDPWGIVGANFCNAASGGFVSQLYLFASWIWSL